MSLHHWTTVRQLGLLLALSSLTVAEMGSAADVKAKLISDSDYPKLLKRLNSGITAALKGGKPSEENAAKAQTAAVLIADAAQQNLDGSNGQQRATVRDAALRIALTIKAGKFADAAKLAAGLSSVKENPSAKKEKITIAGKYISFADLMHQFRPKKEGGWGVYGHLQQLQTKQYTVLPRGEVNENFILEADQVALTADVALNVVPKGKPKMFTANLENMRQAAAELADALKEKDAAKAAPPVLSKLTTACFGCHRTFRDK